MCKLTEEAGNDRIGCQRTNRQRQEHEKRERSSHDVPLGELQPQLGLSVQQAAWVPEPGLFRTRAYLQPP